MGKFSSGFAGSLVFLSLCTTPLLGANRTWNGAGSNSNWTTSANWNAPVAPSDTLFFAGTTRLNAFNDFSPATQFNGMTFNSGAGAFTLSGNAINLNGNITNNSTSLQTIDLDMALVSARSIETTAGNVIVNGVISGAFALGKSGSGTLTLPNANTFSGRLNAAAGVVNLAHSQAAQNAVLSIQVTNGVTFAAGIGNFTVSGLRGSQALALQDTAGQAIALTIQGNGPSDGFAEGNLTGAGSVTLNMNTSGVQVFQGAKTYTGGTTINSGTLELFAGNNILSVNGALAVNGGALRFTRATTQTQTVTSLSGTGGVISVGHSANTTTLTANQDADTTFSGAIENGSGRLNFVKSGTGSLTLSGSNSYTGSTTVSGGQLMVDGQLGATAVTVGSGAALGGNGGSVGGNVTVNNGGAMAFALTGDAAPILLDLGGSLLLGSSVNLVLSLEFIPAFNQMFTLLKIGGEFPTNPFATVNGAAFGAENTFSLTYADSTYDFRLLYEIDSIRLQSLTVPEPSAILLTQLAICFLLWKTRRSRNLTRCRA